MPCLAATGSVSSQHASLHFLAKRYLTLALEGRQADLRLWSMPGLAALLGFVGAGRLALMLLRSTKPFYTATRRQLGPRRNLAWLCNARQGASRPPAAGAPTSLPQADGDEKTIAGGRHES